jgi:hypothetical protein
VIGSTARAALEELRGVLGGMRADQPSPSRASLPCRTSSRGSGGRA